MKLFGGNAKSTKYASIAIGVVASFLLVVVGYNLVQGSRADDSAPRDVVVSDITQNSIKAGWSTGQDAQSVIEYGTSPTALNFFAPESQKTKQHSVDLTLLSPNTTYYFQIRVADKKYDNGGVPWTFTTKSAQAAATPTVAATVAPTAVPETVAPTSAAAPSAAPTTVVATDYSATCGEVTCPKILEKLGKGCSSQDYVKCLKKAN